MSSATFTIKELEEFFYLKKFLKRDEPAKPKMVDASTQTNQVKDTISMRKRKSSNTNEEPKVGLHYLSIPKNVFDTFDKHKRRRISNNFSAAVSRRKSKILREDISDKTKENLVVEIELIQIKRRELFGDAFNGIV